MKRLYFIIFFNLIFHNVWAQSRPGSVQGAVQDEVTGEALVGVTIQIEGTTIGTTTDVNGNFRLARVPSGAQTLKISFIGFATYTATIQVPADREVKLPPIRLGEEAIGLEEIEIFANVVDENRQAPTPIATISAQDIDEQLGAQEFPEILKSTPGVFVNTVSGSFGDAQVRIRGFGSENTAVLINGIPVNDMENGRVFWSNWGGLNDVTRNKQVQRGLGVSKLAVSSVGGTINIITKPTAQRKGIRFTYSNANRSWSHRVMFSASTGLMKGDWALTVAGSTRQGDGFRAATDTDSWSYFVSAYKGFGKTHQLVLTAFGAPQTTNRASRATEDTYQVLSFQDDFSPEQINDFISLVESTSDVDDDAKRYNPAWGTLNGETLNVRRNRFHKPVIMLNHYWDISENVDITTSAYYSLGRGGGTNISRVADTDNPIPNIRVPGDQTFQVQWEDIVAENQANIVSLFTGDRQLVQGAQSRYIIHESRNDHNWVGALTTLNADVNEDFSLTFGLDYRWYRGFHFQEVVNLLGGDFWIDRERFNDQPYNNLLEPRNTPKGVGDKVGYDYTGTVVWGGAFAQGEYTIRNLDLFVTGTVVRSGFRRNGKFLHEEFINSSLGFSPWYLFTNYTVKAGANYRITGRHNVFFNSGFFTRAPFFQEAFVDNRVSNEVRGDLVSEEIFSLEAGYGYRSARFAANINVYRTEWANRAFTTSFFSDTFEDFVTFRMFNVGALHQGIELDFVAKLTPALTLKGAFSYGDWTWDGNASAFVFADPGLGQLTLNEEGQTVTVPNGENAEPVTVFIDGLRVGGSAQTVSSMNLHYRSPKFWYIGISGNYYDRLFVDYNPETRTNPTEFFNQAEELPNAITLDMYAGKSWKLSRDVFFQIKASVNNITDNQFIIDSFARTATIDDPFPSPFVQYYFGRTYFISAVFNVR